MRSGPRTRAGAAAKPRRPITVFRHSWESRISPQGPPPRKPHGAAPAKGLSCPGHWVVVVRPVPGCRVRVGAVRPQRLALRRCCSRGRSRLEIRPAAARHPSVAASRCPRFAGRPARFHLPRCQTGFAALSKKQGYPALATARPSPSDSLRPFQATETIEPSSPRTRPATSPDESNTQPESAGLWVILSTA